MPPVHQHPFRRLPSLAAQCALGAAVLAAALSTGAAWAAGRVELSFTDPGKFADAGRSASDRERTLAGLRAHFERYAQRLPEGQTLAVEITDIDLAGEIRPTARGEELRVLRGEADWPRISLTYTLSADGRRIAGGTERLSDMAYMQSGGSRDAGELFFERRMLDRWFRKAILEAGARGR